MTSCSIELFDPEKHDRTAFRCGVPAVDNYFRMTAGKLARAENVRLFVLLSPARELIGFYAVNAHAVRYEDLPAPFSRSRPGHGYIPAGFISMMGRDERFRGHRYGSVLLADALKTLARAADSIGLAVVMLDVLDCGDAGRTARRRALYEGFGFTPLASNPMRMFLPIQAVRSILASLGQEDGGP